MAFFVGQKGVCVNVDAIPGWPFGGNGVVTPELGVVYTIRDIFAVPGYYDEWRVRLVEIKNPVKQYRTGPHETGWGFSRFRPVVDLGWAHSIVARVMDKGRARV